MGHLGHHLVSSLLTPLLPFIRDAFVLNYTQSGLVASSYNLSYGFGQLPGGWFADRVAPRKLVAVGISGVAVAGLLVGLSSSYTMMIVFFVLMGVVGGTYHPAAAPLVSALAEAKNRGRVLGLHQIGGTLSFFSGPLIVAATAVVLGWRGSFFVVSIPIVVFGIVFYVLLGRLGYKGKTKEAVSESKDKPAPAETPIIWRYVAPFIILSIAGETLVNSTILFTPLFLVDNFGISEGAAAGLLALVYTAGFWAGPLGGYLSDRFGKVNVMVGASFLAGPVIYLLSVASFGWAMSMALVGLGLSMFIRMPVAESYFISHTSERRRSTVLGIYYFGTRGGPGVVMPIMGNLADRFGFDTTFTIIGASMAAIAIICSLFLWKGRDRPSRA